MDTKSLAKSKRAHSQHHKKHHPNQKAKATTSTAGPSKSPGKIVKEKPQHSVGPPALPSNWDRYDDEIDPNTENQKDDQPSDIIVPKSKGADYAYLISEAKSQNSTRISSEIFPSLDDFISDFGQGKDSFFAVQGESLLSSIQNDSFFVEDKKPASYETSFLSLNLQHLSEQLAKIDLPKRLFMEADSELYPEGVQEPHINTNRNKLISKTKSVVNESKYKPEAEDSFADISLKEKPLISRKTTLDIDDINDTLDDLLKETAIPAPIDEISAPLPSSTLGFVSNHSQPVSKFDDFDSWLNTI